MSDASADAIDTCAATCGDGSAPDPCLSWCCRCGAQVVSAGVVTEEDGGLLWVAIKQIDTTTFKDRTYDACEWS